MAGNRHDEEPTGVVEGVPGDRSRATRSRARVGYGGEPNVLMKPTALLQLWINEVERRLGFIAGHQSPATRHRCARPPPSSHLDPRRFPKSSGFAALVRSQLACALPPAPYSHCLPGRRVAHRRRSLRGALVAPARAAYGQLCNLAIPLQPPPFNPPHRMHLRCTQTPRIGADPLIRSRLERLRFVDGSPLRFRSTAVAQGDALFAGKRLKTPVRLTTSPATEPPTAALTRCPPHQRTNHQHRRS